MKKLSDPSNPPIERGIGAVGVGKKGSKSMDAALAMEIVEQLRSGTVHPVTRAAFVGALMMKGVSEEEKVLEQAFLPGAFEDMDLLANAVIEKEIPIFVREVCVQLLKKETMNVETSKKIGQFLFSEEIGNAARGLMASILRVRYETEEEYFGIWQAMQATLEIPFCTSVLKGAPVLQMAEPFDGVERGFLITPLLASYFSQRYRVISLVGDSSGPKFGLTLKDLAVALGGKCIAGNHEIEGENPDFGFFADQKDISKALFRWVAIRKRLKKRPFAATLERLVKLCDARILLTSAFHTPYLEKMTRLAENVGFTGVIVVNRGMEGTLAFPLTRPIEMLCAAKQKDGTYLRNHFELAPETLMRWDPLREVMLKEPTVSENVHLIQAFHKTGCSGNEPFDRRVHLTRKGLDVALEWVEQNIFSESL